MNNEITFDSIWKVLPYFQPQRMTCKVCGTNDNVRHIGFYDTCNLVDDTLCIGCKCWSNNVYTSWRFGLL